MAGDLWTQIPTSLLGLGDKLEKAEDWATQQKAQIGQLWAQTQKNALNATQNALQQQASGVMAHDMTPDGLLKSTPEDPASPLPMGKTLPNEGSNYPNPADILSGTPANAFDNQPHLQPGTPESAWYKAMREGASHSGIFIEPDPNAIIDPQEEMTLHEQAEQNKTRPLLGPGGVGLYNPNLNPEGFKQQVNPGEPGEVLGKTIDTEVPGLGGGLLKFAAGAEGEGGEPSKGISQAVSPELAQGQLAARTKAQAVQQPLTKILGGKFYSPAEKIILEKAPSKATGQQFLNTLINNGAKPAELAWTGLKEFLTSKAEQPLLKSEVHKFIQDNMVQVKEVVKETGSPSSPELFTFEARDREAQRLFGDAFDHLTENQQNEVRDTIEENADDIAAGSTTYSGTVLKGGSNYRELLLTLPNQPRSTYENVVSRLEKKYGVGFDTEALTPTEQTEMSSAWNKLRTTPGEATSLEFHSSHWDEPNILAHVRFDDRPDPTNPQGKTLFLQEVQSDWAQQGRKQGFANPQRLEEVKRSLEDIRTAAFKDNPREWRETIRQDPQWIQLNEEFRHLLGAKEVPPMPFQKTEDWVKLAAKRMVAWAADNGYTRIGWTTGAQQDKIEGLGQRFSDLSFNPTTRELTGIQHDGDTIRYAIPPYPSESQDVQLGQYIGQDAAQRLLATTPDANGLHHLSGPDLSAPTKGMAGFYDQILPSVFKDLGKQFGATVEDVNLTRTQNANGWVEKGPSGKLFFAMSNEGELGSFYTQQEADAALKEWQDHKFGVAEAIHSITLPPKMLETAKRGQALFTPPSVGGGVAGGVYGSQQPAETDQQRVQNIGRGALGGALLGRGLEGISRGKSPPLGASIEDVSKGFTRYFHGTGKAFDATNPQKLRNGSLGPGLYLTQNPEDAAFFSGRSAVNSFIKSNRKNAEAQALKGRSADEILPEAYQSGAAQGAQVRPVLVPNDLNILSFGDKISKDVIEKVRSVLTPSELQVFDRGGSKLKTAPILSSEKLPSTGIDLWYALQKAYDLSAEAKGKSSGWYGQKTGREQRASDILTQAGYDGVKQDAGNALEHDKGQLVIFPGSLSKIKNALTGTVGGSPPTIGGAVVGGAYGSQQSAQTDQERVQNIGQGIVGGALFGRGLEAAGRGESLPFGLSIKPVFQDADLQRTADMIHADAPKAGFLASQTFADRLTRNLTRAWSDAGVDHSRLQESIAQNLGRHLDAGEQLAQLRMLNPNPAAELNLRQNFAPALQQVGPKDQTALSMYLIYRHNIEVAHAAGEKEAQKILGQDLKNLPAKDQLRSLQARLNMYNRFLQQGIAANDGTVIMHYQPLIATTQKLVTNAQNRLNQQTITGRIAQAAQATAASAQVAADRKFSAGFRLDSSIDSLTKLQQELGPQRFANIEDAAQKVVTFGRSLLQKKVDAGIITQDFANELIARYPEYVPIKILDHMIESVSVAGGRGKALSMSDKGIKALTQEGTEKLQEDPLAAMVRQAYQVESMSGKNDTFNALHNLMIADAGKAVPQWQGIIQKVDNAATPDRVSSIVRGFVDGAPVAYRMPKDLADGIESQARVISPGLQAAMNIMRAALASANPLFIPTHAIITVLPYMMRTATREGGPAAIPKVIGALASGYWDALIRPALTGDIFKGRYGANTERYLAGGGGMFGNLFEYSPAAAKASLEDLSRSNVLQVRSTKDALKLGLNVLKGKPFAEIINRVDLAPRVAAMRLAEKRGMNTAQAISEGRTSTIDFAQGGTFAKTVNQFIPFFNVAVQGTAVPVRAMRDNPKAFIGTAITLLAAPTIGVEAWNRADPQRAADYDNVPNYYKDTGIVIMAPGSATLDAQGNRKPNFVYIPTREYSPFVIATRELAGRVMGAQPRGWQSILYGGDLNNPNGGLLGSVSPVADTARLMPGGPIGNLYVASRTGVNPTTGGAITSKAADARAGSVAQGISGAVNAARVATGGTGAVQPSSIQYGLQELGGPGKALASIGQPQGEGINLNPVVKNATGQELRNSKEQRLSPELVNLLNSAGMTDVSPASATIANMPLRQDEEAELQKNLNAAFEQVAQKVMQDPRYQKWTSVQRSVYAKRVLDNTRSIVGQKFLQELSKREGVQSIRQRILQAKKAS